MNVRLMLDDSARSISLKKDEESGEPIKERRLNTKEDIQNYLKGIM